MVTVRTCRSIVSPRRPRPASGPTCAGSVRIATRSWASTIATSNGGSPRCRPRRAAASPEAPMAWCAARLRSPRCRPTRRADRSPRPRDSARFLAERGRMLGQRGKDGWLDPAAEADIEFTFARALERRPTLRAVRIVRGEDVVVVRGCRMTRLVIARLTASATSPSFGDRPGGCGPSTRAITPTAASRHPRARASCRR